MNRLRAIREVSEYVTSLQKQCPTMDKYGFDFATLGENDGDACLFNGLLSTVGVAHGTNGVRLSQARKGEPFPGMFYRSPIRRSYGKDLRGHKTYFSRDMALGVLAYYTGNPVNNDSASAWLSWIDKSRPCTVKKPKWLGGGCLIRGAYTYAPDDRSTITPTMWALMHRVWSYRGWKLHKQMDVWNKFDGDASIIEAQTCDLGYPLHLKAVQAYIKFLMGVSSEYSKKVGEIAHSRIPENLFYEFLCKRSFSTEAINRYLEMRPDVDQKFGTSWLWEKKDMSKDRIKQSAGWDFVFLGKLILNYR